MSSRYVSLPACLLLTGFSAFGQGNQGTGYVFELPGPASAGSNLQGFVYNGSFLSPEVSATGPAGARQIIAKPDGSRFYILGANTGGFQSIDPTFTSFSAINGIVGAVCTAAITPDGRYLLVGAATAGSSGCGPNSNSNSLYILDTSTNAILSNTLPPPSAGIIGFAVSPDSSTAWMLTNSAATGATVTAFSLNSRTETATLRLPYGDGTSIALAPSGLLYVTGGGAIYEITTTGTQSTCNANFASIPPLCITPTGFIQVQAAPGTLRFTPSGQVAYAINTDPVSYSQSLLELNLASHSVASWPPTNSGITPPAFADVLVAGENLIYAITTTDPHYPTTLWDVNPSTLSATPDTTFSMFQATSVISAALSNEAPSAIYLYALVGNGNQTLLYRVKLADKSYVRELALLGPGLLQFAVVPPEAGAAGFYSYTPTSQTLPSGVTSVQVTALVLDATGRPVYKQPVTFAESVTDPITGMVITGATPATNANGYVTATVTVPATPSTYTVVLTAGSAHENFSLTVPGGMGGGGGGGSSNQVTIVSGNGEFIQEQFRLLNEPLTIQVVDSTGKPMAGVPVTFAITGDPIGQLDNPHTATDANGLASTDFTSPNLPAGQNIAFDSTTVNASTPVGSVNFVETVYRQNPNGTGAPQISVVSPVSQQLTIGEGDVLANGIIESIQTTFTGVSQPVPNIGIRLASGSDSTQPGPASCQGSSLSDMNGLAHCNVYVSCQAGLGVVQGGINAVVGEKSTTIFALTVVPGTSQVLNIKSGNNQTGIAGGTLPLPLVAAVTDNCGNAHSNVPVTWKITQGSATLINTLSTSDAGGNVHTSVALGQTPGTVLVTVSAGAAQAVFTLTNTQFQLPAFFTGEVSLGSSVYYLQFPNGNLLGYYTFVASSVFYHYDMGFETFIPGSAADIYLFDFNSNHWLYSSSTLFPYLYDFTLKSWIYYFPDGRNPGHYTTNPRYFSNLATGKVFSM